MRRGWSIVDYACGSFLVLGLAIGVNAFISSVDYQWATITQSWQGRLWSLGMEASSGFAIGLGLLPVVGGLASLWIPSRRDDPAWRGFAAFTGGAVLTVWTYTAIKAAYLSTVFATRVEERNLIYLGPLLIVGCVVFFTSRRAWLPGMLIAWGFTTWLVLYYGYQLDYPYFEAPGYGIATMANRAFRWDSPTIRTGLAVTAGIALVFALVPFVRRTPHRLRQALLLVAAAATLTWMLAGEITSARGASSQSRAFAAHLPKPFDWIDRATSQSDTTFMGQYVTISAALGINIEEFWNRSIRHVWTLDGTGPGPGPTLTPDLVNRYGVLSNDPGLRYVAAMSGVDLVGKRIAVQPGLTLTRIDHHPWRLAQTEFGVSGDGWISGTPQDRVARGSYAYFGPHRGAGTLDVRIGRAGFCQPIAPGANVLLRIGSVALNSQRQPIVAQAQQIRRFYLKNCQVRDLRFPVRAPVALDVRVAPTVRPSDYGSSETRELGAQVSFGFIPKR